MTRTLGSWRSSKEYREWQAAVFIKDKFKCVKCSSQDGIVSDHIKSAYLYPYLRFIISNGRTLCYSCHHKFGEKIHNDKSSNINSFFGGFRMQLTGAGGETVRTSFPRWLIGLILRNMKIEEISAREFVSNYRIEWHWNNGFEGAWAKFVPKKESNDSKEHD